MVRHEPGETTPAATPAATTAALEAALMAALDEPDALPLAWVVLVAYRSDGQADETGYFRDCAAGQPHHTTLGLLMTAMDAMRGVGADD